ncbi:hypothetical protein [Reichenbachiella sp.]
MNSITNSNSNDLNGLAFWPLRKMVSLIQNDLQVRWILLLFIAFSCRPNTVSFESFDSSLWIAESKTCTGYRNDVINDMEAEFDLFIGMSETELIKYLGNPGKTLLYTRGQKFFNYHIDCPNQPASTRQLRVRFSALDYVNEVLILD